MCPLSVTSMNHLLNTGTSLTVIGYSEKLLTCHLDPLYPVLQTLEEEGIKRGIHKAREVTF